MPETRTEYPRPDRPLPRPGDVFKHFKGDFYRIRATGPIRGGADEGKAMVAYIAVDGDPSATPNFRPHDDFLCDVVDDNGIRVERFALFDPLSLFACGLTPEPLYVLAVLLAEDGDPDGGDLADLDGELIAFGPFLTLAAASGFYSGAMAGMTRLVPIRITADVPPEAEECRPPSPVTAAIPFLVPAAPATAG